MKKWCRYPLEWAMMLMMVGCSGPVAGVASANHVRVRSAANASVPLNGLTLTGTLRDDVPASGVDLVITLTNTTSGDRSFATAEGCATIDLLDSGGAVAWSSDRLPCAGTSGHAMMLPPGASFDDSQVLFDAMIAGKVPSGVYQVRTARSLVGAPPSVVGLVEAY